MDIRDSAAAIASPIPTDSLIAQKQELTRQVDRIDTVIDNLASLLQEFIKPDMTESFPSPPEAVDIDPRLSPTARFIGNKADALRLVTNRLEALMARIDA